jgi:hypothetical protein
MVSYTKEYGESCIKKARSGSAEREEGQNRGGTMVVALAMTASMIFVTLSSA